MSSSQNNSETKRMKSIAGKFVGRITWTKIKEAFSNAIGLFVLLSFLYLANLEFTTFGKLTLLANRRFVILEGIDSLTYLYLDSAGKELISENIFMPVVVFIAIADATFIFGSLGAVFSIYKEKKKVRTILAPLNELAVRADEIANFEFDEDKYALLENAISRIEPDDNKEILLHDQELQGIENAMNSLIGRMKENYRQQARFVNDASHELRTPIAVIEGYANMLERWGREDEKVLDESITAISNEAANMKHLVEQLLFLARGDSGKTTLKLEDVNLNLLMQEIYEESLMIDESHPYRFKNADTEIVVSADAGLLKQAVRILVDNASKYTKQGDEIILGVGRDERPYLLVQDSGIGLSEQDIEHMFERFYRADEARTKEGTGLGLSIAKWIVDKHGGSFSVLSRTDLGTRIKILL